MQADIKTPVNSQMNRPLCSILSCVINQVMVPATPLEPKEFHESVGSNDSASEIAKPPNIRVPVLRVFGPIIRGDAPSGADPVQSACLYIHGAFPYMLARPVTAGPDGSLHHSSHLMRSGNQCENQPTPPLTSSGHVDWDDPEAIKGIASSIEQTLESALQATVMSPSKNNDDGAAETKAKETSAGPAKFIRSVTVVLGRGFYTFCPGPAAPFLRVEYYDPKMKYKVKLYLERGLELPRMYHPDPQQYDAVGDLPAADSSQLGMDPLSFHCYEAHIPYTMQFFKDWNLAGASYIHVSKGKFRRTLPSAVRRRWEKDGDDGGTSADRLAFLSFNTPKDSIWNQESNQGDDASSTVEKTTASERRDSGIDKQSTVTTSMKTKSLSLSQQQLKQYWATKETSCDVEIDIACDDIMNIQSVITVLPTDEVESQNIHWRAVPSLREIWQEERRRMAKLLEPQHDFLSRPSAAEEEKKKKEQSQPPFTLSVKKGASTPGSRLAAKGMRRLLRVTEGLESAFMRALKQIVQRHSAAISQVDGLLKSSPATRSSPGTPHSTNSSSQLTPTINDALGAMGALAGQFGSADPNEPNEESSQSDASGATVDDEESTEELARDSDPSKDGSFTQLSQSCYTLLRAPGTPITEEACFNLSQRLERGDAIVDGPFNSTKDFVDPQTLAPREDDDDEDVFLDEEGRELDEAGVERELTLLATQMHWHKDNPELEQSAVEGSEWEKASEYSPLDSTSHDVSSSNSSASSIASGGSLDGSSVERGRKANGQNTSASSAVSKPPSRGAFQSGVYLHSLPESRSTASWLEHANAYETSRNAASVQSNWIPSTATTNRFYIQPTKPPPRRDEVMHWCRQEAKRTVSEGAKPDAKKIKMSNSRKLREVVSATHQVDDNTGKVILAKPHSEGSEVANYEQVEAVSFVQSQTQASAMTQEEGEQRKLLHEPKQEGGSKKPWLTAASAMGSQSLARVAADLSHVSQVKQTADPDQKALQGMQNQGGKLVVEGGGQLKAKTRPSQSVAKQHQDDALSEGTGFDDRYLPLPLTMMSIEIHCQCRRGRASGRSTHEIAMTPDPDRDKIFVIAYAFARDPGGGGALEILERGCLYVPITVEGQIHETLSDIQMKSSMPRQILGVTAPLTIQQVKDEKQLLLRLASVVRWKDPDMLLSWDTQGAGLGYIIERGAKLGDQGVASDKLDMARLLGRIPTVSVYDKAKRGTGEELWGTSGGQQDSGKESKPDPASWVGSGLGADWDESVGAGKIASSIVGRLVYAGWKIIAEEVKHPNYSSLCAMVSAVLSKRIPFHDEVNLTNWYACLNGRERWRVLNHRLAQCTATVLLFDALDIVGRAGEAARLSGVEFSQSFPGIRGSQYKVEGVLLRALQSLDSEERGCKLGQQTFQGGGTSSTSPSDESKSQATSPWKKRRSRPKEEEKPPRHGYFFFSPSLQDTEKQEALEVQALNLEPQSGHYSDPVVVCDFTALYPSLVIAYNLCYSTCVGKLKYHTTRPEMLQEGKTTGRIGPFLYSESRTATVLKHHLKAINETEEGGKDCFSSKDRVYISPTSTLYVSESVVKGVLPQVLDELLSTRAMLKKASKEYKKRVQGLSPSILRQLEARQLALKYVANVTYGYTSATFSGRCAMPVLADTIVECGRRTLTNAMRLANSWGKEPGGRWEGAKVLYGDTDSVFVKLPGRSVEEAFDFGEVFCREVTASNPPPVQLKLEKVYLGSILQTKKKYCGMVFESKDSKNPYFEAKGLETVRRDQCSLTQKVLRNSLIMLFRHGVAAVKDYLFRQWSLIIAGRLPVSDFILTGRVRSKYRNGSLGPVQAGLFRRLAESDPGLVMKNKERIEYVMVAMPGSSYKLRDCVVTPMELLEQWDAYTVFSSYYIKRHVNAALQRCFGLAPHTIDINAWFESCPKPRKRVHFWPVARTGSSSMISSYFGTDRCGLCGGKCQARGRARAVICPSCREDEVKVSMVANRKLQRLQREANAVAKACSACNLCFEDATTFAPLRTNDNSTELVLSTSSGKRQKGVATPLAACTSTDCPNTYQRHRLREDCLEAEAICLTLESLPP